MRENSALVTGAASPRGIGRTVARRLAAHGWNLALMDLDREHCEQLAEQLRSEFGVAVIATVADVSSEADVAAALDEAQRIPPLTALVNSAGISDPTPFLDTSMDRWNRVMRINATGTFNVTKQVLPGMIERRYGRVVSIGSTAAQNGGGTYSKAAYAASKAAIEGLTRGVALEVAPHGVTVNAIAPAIIDTDMMGGTITEERAPSFLGQLPVGRLGRPEEVAALIEFLIGEDAGFITGATYNINGGIRIG